MRFLRKIWSSSEFDAQSLTRFAQPVVREEARQGIFALAVMTLLLMAGLAALHSSLELRSAYLDTFALLGLLALHVAVSAKLLPKTSDVRVFYMLGIALLALGALAFALLASRYNAFTATLFSAVALLFMVVPLVPWGMREALLAIGSVYAIFTGASLGAAGHLAAGSLLTLQFLMAGAAATSLALVWRATAVRKGHLEARFNLTQMNEKLALTSLQDPLTGAWNRRFLDERYEEITAGYARAGQGYCLALVDVDKFKQVNDSYGHSHGDLVLKRLANVLDETRGPEGYVARIGGDEFLLLMRGAGGGERLERACGELYRRKKDRPGAPPMPSVSIGVARVPPGVQVPLEEAYAVADQAMYAAKDNGRAAVVEIPVVPEGAG